MPVLSAPATPTHELAGARFTTLATPSLGTSETAVWTVEILPGADAVPHEVTREEIFVALAGEARATLDGAEHRVREATRWWCRPASSSRSPRPARPFRAVVCLPVGGQAVLPGGEPFTPPWAV